MSRGLGLMQRLIIGAMDGAQRLEPHGAYERHQWFEDRQGEAYHPAQVVRVGWLTQVVARACDGFWSEVDLVLDPAFKASFSRSLRTLKARDVVRPVRIYSSWVVRPVAEHRGQPYATYWRRDTDCYIARNPAVSVNSCRVNTYDLERAKTRKRYAGLPADFWESFAARHAP
jgi:hypothetical protein